jgi:acyl-CoA synthetase (AMP-forming)/AMP-acid ligase II
MTDRIDLLHGLVSSAAAEVPDRAAIISPDGSSVTFAQFDAQVGSVAGWVSERTRRGDRIAVIADNGAAYARLYYGVPRGGRILTLINQRLSAGEQTIQLASAEPTILAGDAGYLDALPRISEHIPSIEHVVAFDDPEWQRAEHVSRPRRAPRRSGR